jgi:multidrug transporter EmrE-like cation transporter
MERFRIWFVSPWVQLAICILLATAGEIFLKLGARVTADSTNSWSWTGLTGLRSQWVWWGIVVSVISLFNWLAAIRKLPLTVAFPLGNAVHILVPLGCWMFLGEDISSLRWGGIAVVLLGLMVIAKPAAQLEERL